MKYLILLLPFFWACCDCPDNNLPEPDWGVMDSTPVKFSGPVVLKPITKQATITPAEEPIPTKPDTNGVYIAKDGTAYPIQVGSKGGKYIIRVSAKTGKEYKQYLK